MKELEGFSTGDLRAEVARRDAAEAEAKRDTSRRKFYRKMDDVPTNFKERAKFIAALPKERVELLEEGKDGALYFLDEETAEELKTRLSRSGRVFWDYDHWRCELFENGIKVGEKGQDSDSTHNVDEWESRPDKYGETEWTLERAQDFLGYSAKPASWYRY